MRILSYITMISFITCMVMTGCSSDDVNDSMTLYDLVTFEGNTEKAAVFSLQKDGDSPMIELTAIGRRVDTAQVKPGQRLFLSYIPESGLPYTSGMVTLRGLSLINYAKIETGAITDWDKTPVYMNSMWRTGVYLNLECRIDYTTDEGRRFMLVADETTIDDFEPQLYVVHDLDQLPQNFTRRIYASWDMSDVWNRPGCHGVKVHIRDSNRNITSMTFNKKQN